MRYAFLDPIAKLFEASVVPRLDAGWRSAGPDMLDAEALIVSRFGPHDPKPPGLRLVQVAGAGYDKVELALVPPTASVCNAYEHEGAIAEYVLAAMLHWTKAFAARDAEMRRGDWSRSVVFRGLPQPALAGQTVAIVGYGRIGREVARRAKAFDMTVVAANRTLRDEPLVDRMVGLSELHEILSAARFVVVAAALAPETRHLIDAAALATLRADAVLINVGRGDLVDQEALLTVLEAHRIGGAVLDVWWRYPVTPQVEGLSPTARFEALDNVVMTPHISGWTEGTVRRRSQTMAENLNRLLRGEPLLNVVVPANA
jgi:phosphoglycerate dehydrogenase-like enzyme